MNDIKISDNIKVSSKLDEYILKGLEDGVEIKNDKVNKRPYLKIAMLVATMSAATITGAYAVGKIIDYFKYNTDSVYKYEEDKMQEYAQIINKSKKHDGVEFRLDTVAADDSYIVVNYTVFSKKKISEFEGELDKNVYTANPFVRLLKGDKEVFDGGNMESEAIFVSDNELKGMMRFRVGRYNLKDGDKLTIDTWEVFGIEKDWSIDFKLNKKPTKKHTKKYNINKSITITQNVEYEGNSIEVKNKITIDNIVIAPLGNTITVTEIVDSPNANCLPYIGDSFAMFDENNNNLSLVSNGGLAPDTPNKPLTSTYEFISSNKNIESITLVPIIYKQDTMNHLLDIQLVDNLPAIFELNEYGKITVDSFEVTEDKIRYSFKKDGFISYIPDLALCDENGEMIILENSFSKPSVDRENNRVDIIIDLESDIDRAKSKQIKNITLYSDSNIKLQYEDKIEFNLSR